MTSLALAGLLLLGVQQDAPVVGMSLERDRVAAGQSVTLTISVDGHVGAVRLDSPDLPAGLLVTGASTFTETRSFGAGRRHRWTRREIAIMAQAPGVYRIPSVAVVVDGRTHHTQSLQLTVTGGARTPGSTQPFGAATTALRLELLPDTVYVGQQLTMRAEATFAEDARSRQARPPSFEAPAPSGFWLQDLPDPITLSLRVREGRTVETQTYTRAYFPLHSGVFWFPPAHLHYELRRGFLQAPESRRISSDSVRVVVLPLPDQGRPASFNGAVGRFEIAVSLTPQTIAVGDAAVLAINVSGRGNVKALPEPRLPVLDGVQVISSTQESVIDVLDGEVGGVKRFRWMVVPETAGTLSIPPVEYAYFDPELRTYITLSSDSLLLQTGHVTAIAPSDTALRPLRTAAGAAPLLWARAPWFGAVQVVPLLLVGAAFAIRRWRRRPASARDHARRFRRELATLDDASGSTAQLAALERLLCETALLMGGATTGDPVALLRGQGRADVAAALESLLFDMQSARYSPGAAGAAEFNALRARAVAVVDTIARSMRSARPARTAAAAAAVILAVIGLGAIGTAVRAADAGFERAVALYQAGDAAAAANAFHAYARSNPRDPSGWYNVGVASWHAGDPGRAVWAWLRALRHSPRDADTHHNLRLAAGADAGAWLLPPDRLATGERLLLAAVAWWVLVLAGAFAAWTRGRAAALTAAAGLAVLVLAGAAGFGGGLRGVHIVPLGQGAAVYAGPSVHDDLIAQLAVGDPARVVERRDGWLLVAVDRSRRGWIERAAVAAP